MHGVAATAAIARGSLLLLLRRAATCEHEPGRWELPGGKLDIGETLPEAVAREVREETSMSITVGPPLKTWHFVRDQYWVTGVTFRCHSETRGLRLGSEHDQSRWLTTSEALELPLAESMREQILALCESSWGPS